MTVQERNPGVLEKRCDLLLANAGKLFWTKGFVRGMPMATTFYDKEGRSGTYFDQAANLVKIGSADPRYVLGFPDVVGSLNSQNYIPLRELGDLVFQ